MNIKCNSKYKNKTLIKKRKTIIVLWLARETISKILGFRLSLVVGLTIIASVTTVFTI